MIRSPGSVTWERVLAQALKGDATHLLDLLLVPVRTDNAGQPLPDEDGQAFYPLPEDRALRERIVRTLMLLGGPRRTTGRPGVSERDVRLAGSWLEAARHEQEATSGRPAAPDYDAAGALIGLSGERLRKRLQAQARAGKSRAKPSGF